MARAQGDFHIHAYVKTEVENFSPERFIRWVCFQYGTDMSDYDDIIPHVASKYRIAEKMLRMENKLPTRFHDCLDKYTKVSEVITKLRQLGASLWPYLPPPSKEGSKLREVLPPNASTEFLSWFGAATFCYDVPDPIIHTISITDAITRPLPGHSPNVVDLTLLAGDFGNVEKDSHIVEKVAAQITSSLHFLVGVSGVGKTKALFDIGRKFVPIYFDFKTGALEKRFCSQVKDLCAIVKDTKLLATQVELEIARIIAARIILLSIMKLKNPQITNEQLLLAQVNGYSQQRWEFYKAIYMTLREAFEDHNTVLAVIATARTILGVDEKHPLVILCDESQVLLQIADGTFKSSRDNSDRSLFHKFVAEAVNHGSVVMAGTSLALIYFDQLDSVSAKIEETFKHKHADFKYIITSEDCRQIIESLFDVKMSEDDTNYILQKLQGRARFITNLALVAGLDRYKKNHVDNTGLTNEQILLKIVDDMHYHLTTFNSTKLEDIISIANTPAEAINQDFDKMTDAFANLVAIYYFKDIKEGYNVPEGANFFASGLVGVRIAPEKSDSYEITEPLIVDAILKAFRRKARSVAAHYLTEFSRVERAIILELSQASCNYKASGILALQNEEGVYAPKHLANNMDIVKYLSSQTPGDFIIHPTDKEQPDICYYNDGVLWLFSSKTTQREDRNSVDMRHVVAGYESTDINKYAQVKPKTIQSKLDLNNYDTKTLASKFELPEKMKKHKMLATIRESQTAAEIEQKLQNVPTKGQKQQQQAIAKSEQASAAFKTKLEELANAGKLRRVMRVHFIFPEASSTTNAPVDSVWTIGKMALPFSCVNVTCSSLLAFTLFSPAFKQKLLQIFDSKKQQSTIPQKRKAPEGNTESKSTNKKQKQIVEEKSNKMIEDD